MRRVVGPCGVLCVVLLASLGGPALAAVSPQASGSVSVTGRIFTVMGTSLNASGDAAGLATGRAQPIRAVAVQADGGFLVAGSARVWRVGTDGRIAVVAGTGRQGFSGDGGPATAAEVSEPGGLAALPDGGFLVSDSGNARVRRVWPDGTITTVAGIGTEGFSGDGAAATAAQLAFPAGVAVLPDGGFLVADPGNSRVRRVWPDGTITTVAGAGTDIWDFTGDGGPATAAQLSEPRGLAVLPDGGYVIGDPASVVVRRVWPDGTISTVVSAQAQALAWTPDGSLLVTDTSLYGVRLVRRVAPDGRKSVIAGGRSLAFLNHGGLLFSGDGGPATAATFGGIAGLAALPDGGLLIAEDNSEGVATARLRLVVGPAGTDTLAAAIRLSLGTALVRGYRLRYVLTKPAQITVKLYRSPNAPPSLTTSRVGPVGESILTATRRRALLPGVYAIELRADAGGQATRTVEYAYLGRRLTQKAIKYLTDDQHISFTRKPPAHTADYDVTEDATRCHRFAQTRIDCVIQADSDRCSWVSSYLLTDTGQISRGSYRCPTRRNSTPFKRHPSHWLQPRRWQLLNGLWKSQR